MALALMSGMFMPTRTRSTRIVQAVPYITGMVLYSATETAACMYVLRNK
jgi:hypothetical protein